MHPWAHWSQSTAHTFLRMPAGEAPHPSGPLGQCNVCYETRLLEDDRGFGGTEARHWFCSQCVIKLHACPMYRQEHPLYTGPSHRETQEEDLSMAKVRMLATQNFWVPPEHIGGRDSPDVEWLETLKSPGAPRARPPCSLARWQMPEGDNPTIWAPDHEPYNTVPRGSLC